jgi:hypothetical protein
MRSQVRVIKAEGPLPYKVQFSPDRLRWTTLYEYDSFEDAKSVAENFAEKLDEFQPMLKVTHILWKSK